MPHTPAPESSLSAEQRELLSARYGSGRSPSWPMIVAIAVTAVLFVSWVVWAAWGQADQDVRWRTIGYSIHGSESVTVEFDVFKPSDSDVECTVRALDIDSNEVGRAVVPVTAAQSDVKVTYDLPVTTRPNTAEVVDCRLQS